MIVKKILFISLAFVQIATCVFAVEAIQQEEPAQQEEPVQQQEQLKVEPARVEQETIQINDDAKTLAGILADTLTYQADFKQSVYRENSDQAEVTTGRFLIQRPNHFRWQTIEPFEQAIIADGDHLWTYDPELEQVTIQNQQSILADSPLLLLTSSVESLVEAFEVIEVNNQNKQNQQLFALSPKKNSLFESVHILIEDKKIKEFFLVDTLGGRTGVEFSNIALNRKVDVKEFIFVPPEGIDIIDSRETITEGR